MRCLLIEDGNRLILIDNGIGNKQDAKFFSHYYLHGDDSLDKSLAALGFHNDDITDVILTHLHFDHCGGSVVREGDKLVPAFKNAVYWSNEQHWQWATTPNEREKASFLKENMLPVQEYGQLQFIAIPGTTLAETGQLPTAIFSEHVNMRFVNGHTGMMMLPQINFNGKTLVYMADLIPAAAHLPIPYVMAYDMFPLTSMQEKKSFLKEALENDFTLFFEPDPLVECCTLQPPAESIRQKNTFCLRELT